MEDALISASTVPIVLNSCNTLVIAPRIQISSETWGKLLTKVPIKANQTLCLHACHRINSSTPHPLTKMDAWGKHWILQFHVPHGNKCPFFLLSCPYLHLFASLSSVHGHTIHSPPFTFPSRYFIPSLFLFKPPECSILVLSSNPFFLFSVVLMT